MKYMLDTNVCIHMIKNKPVSVVQKFRQHRAEDVCVSSITYAELCYGVSKSRFSERNLVALSVQFGKIRAGLESSGRPVGVMDLLIAAHALSLGLTVVTNNTREFERIPGLAVEDWVS